MYFVSLLMNSTFINSQYKKFDLELLQNTSDKSIFIDLFPVNADIMLDFPALYCPIKATVNSF